MDSLQRFVVNECSTQIKLQLTFKAMNIWKITDLVKISKNSSFSRIFKILKIRIVDLCRQQLDSLIYNLVPDSMGLTSTTLT